MALFRNVVALECQAQVAHEARLYEDASVLHGRAALIAQQLGESQLVAVLCFRLGAALRANHAMLDAVAAYEAGFQVLCTETKPNIGRVLASLQTIGMYFFRFDRIAMPNHDDTATAAELQSAMCDTALPARLLLECAAVYQSQSSLYLALYTYRRLLEQLETARMLELRADILARLGAIAYRLGELVTFEDALNELVGLRTSTTDPQLLCHVLPALGALYQAIGSGENALSVYREALKLSLRVGDPVAIGKARGRLTRLVAEQRNSQHDLALVQEQVGMEAEAYEAYTPETMPSNTLHKRPMPELVYIERVAT